MTVGSAGLPYAAVHALTILGTTVAVYGALGIALSPVIGPIPGVTFSRVVGAVVFVLGASLTVWGLTRESD
ncbi:hypothetical protein ACFQDG_05250 [Natronoarchaeum mannanilyticum]|uniref:Uncharacterized protein n=1 Tax=Natronoarchaeum mannanilyticum TaxID=926360 RepID=A0AAV3TCB6_9EURY